MRTPTQAERRRMSDRLRQFLDARRCEIAQRLRVHEISPTEVDEVRDHEDEAVEDLRHELDLALAQMKSQALQGIEDAIHRLEAGRYGICGDCGATIGRARLRALPFAASCRECQAEREAVRWVGPPRERAVAADLCAF